MTLVLASCLFAYLFIGLFPAHAANDAVEVSPSILRLDLATDEPGATLYYKNTGSETVSLTFNASDVTELEEGYKLSFLEQKDAKNYRYSLSSWITFDQQTLILNPHETATIVVSIDKKKLTPGGHYGAVLAHITTQNPKGNVAVNGALSTLVFVRTNTGRENEAGQIEKFAPVQEGLSFPSSFVIRFNNTGDVDLTPYGLVTIKDMFGRTVAKAILNEDSLTTLPESIRRYDVQAKPGAGLYLVPGMYTAQLEGHFGKTNKKISAQTTFFSEGGIPFIPLGIGLLIAILLWVKFRKKVTK